MFVTFSSSGANLLVYAVHLYSHDKLGVVYHADITGAHS